MVGRGTVIRAIGDARVEACRAGAGVHGAIAPRMGGEARAIGCVAIALVYRATSFDGP